MLVVPAKVNPLRSAPAVQAGHRLEMVRLALAGLDGVACDDREIRRSEPSYMILTLASLVRENPGAVLVLVVGADAFVAIDRWHRYRELLEMTNFAVVNRAASGSEELPSWAQGLVPRRRLDRDVPSGQLLQLEMPPCDVSSTEIRRRLAAHEEIAGMVPAAVLSYIQSENLYV